MQKKKREREREREGFPGGASGKNSLASVGHIKDAGSIPESGRSPEGGNGNPPQHFFKNYYFN